MSRIPTAISTGLCTCAGVGSAVAADIVFGGNGDLLKKLDLFDSPRYADKFVGRAFGYKRGFATECGAILMAALDESLSRLDAKAFNSERVGVFLGTSIGGIFETENMLIDNINSKSQDLRALTYYECSTLAELVAKKVGARGVCMTFSTACSSSSLAVSAACDAIEQGKLDAAIVCGADSLSRITVNGFGSLLLLSAGKCKPFDANRDGINLGEAAGVIILSSADFAAKINAQPLAEFSACSCTADAYHQTSPHPSGDGAANAFENALRKSKLTPIDVDFYIAHGTATRGNDIAEIAALRQVFGAHKLPKFASLKRYFGHTLGASGILNCIMAIESLRRCKSPANAGFTTKDDLIGDSPIIETSVGNIENILTSSLGFGGNNSCAVISKKSKKSFSDQKPRDVYLFSCGVLTSYAIGAKNVFAEISKADFNLSALSNVCQTASLLKNVPILKKRKWAKLQQIGLQCALEATEVIDIKSSPERTGVCMGTGLGMMTETFRFLKNTIERREAEPLPTAFTNSVHNAVASLISLNKNFRGVNSAVTAKEISFESALYQAIGAIDSGDIDAAIVGGADEYFELAQKYLESRRNYKASAGRLADFCSLYFAGAIDACITKPFAKIVKLDISRRDKSPTREAFAINQILSLCNDGDNRIKTVFTIKGINENLDAYIDAVLEKTNFSDPLNMATYTGLNYSASAFAPVCAAYKFGKGRYAAYICASTGMRSLFIFDIL